MPIVDLLEASRIERAPSLAVLLDLSRKKNPHAFFISNQGKMQIDTGSNSWQIFLSKQSKNAQLKPNTVKEISQRDEELQGLIDEATNAKLHEPILKQRRLKLQIQQQQLEFKKASGRLIDYAVCRYLFNAFMDTTNTELLLLVKKLEVTIRNLCKDNKPDEIIKLLTREHEVIINDVKDKQKKTVANWRESLKNV